MTGVIREAAQRELKAVAYLYFLEMDIDGAMDFLPVGTLKQSWIHILFC